MDFFERQDRARQSTRWLVLYFIAAVLCIIAGLYLVFAGIFLRGRFAEGGVTLPALWDLRLFLGVAGGTCLVVLLGSLYKTAELRRGGAAVAEMLGGKRISPNTRDPDERKLLNIVEEMALASGMGVPPVYLLAEEEGINAFAAGFEPNDAVIGVTRGCMKLLNRDELQGVVAHEFSHILNGDMRLNLRLMGVIFGILCLAVMGRVLLYSGHHRSYRLGAKSGNSGGNPLPLIGLALIAIGSIGVLFGRLIQAAVSRQREFLADAAAVQFTRNPAGIGGALKKIGGFLSGSKLATPHASEASHLFFGNALSSSFAYAFATHPPLEKRIRAIEPNFDGKFPQVKMSAMSAESPLVAGLAEGAPPPPLPRQGGRAPARSVSARTAIQDAGNPAQGHLEIATAWRESLPETLSAACHDPGQAPAVVYSMLLDDDRDTRERQLNAIAHDAGSDAADLTRELRQVTRKAGDLARLPLVELCINALRELTADEYLRFRALARKLIEADRRIDLFEYALEKCLGRHLAPTFDPGHRTITAYYALAPLLDDGCRVLSLLARIGHTNAAGAELAYAEAIRVLGKEPYERPMLGPEQAGLKQADQGLARLAQASPIIKRQFLQAAALAVASDGELQVREAELLRAVADALDCPIPPFIQLHRPVD